MPKRLGIWKHAGPNRKSTDVKAEQRDPQTILITARATLGVVPQVRSGTPYGGTLRGTGSQYSNTYTVFGSGDILI
ncbi:unnamed protein product, partial [marine sediment metagenome]